jgi:hypothetical protein
VVSSEKRNKTTTIILTILGIEEWALIFEWNYFPFQEGK